MASSTHQSKGTPPLNFNHMPGHIPNMNYVGGSSLHPGTENMKSGIVGTSLNGPLVSISHNNQPGFHPKNPSGGGGSSGLPGYQ